MSARRPLPRWVLAVAFAVCAAAVPLAHRLLHRHADPPGTLAELAAWLRQSGRSCSLAPRASLAASAGPSSRSKHRGAPPTAGYRNGQHILKDPDLEPVRRREAFSSLCDNAEKIEKELTAFLTGYMYHLSQLQALAAVAQ